MSSAPFPERIDAVKMFARMGTIAAELPLARLQRISDQLSGNSGQVAVDLQFGTDEDGRRLLAGTLDTRVQVACQRCLQDMDLDLHCDMSLLVFDTEAELQELPESRDGVVMTEDGLDVVALIEDELMLSLPMIPMHADTACNRVLNALKQGDGTVVKERPNPFAILAGLKAKAAAKPTKPSGKARPAKAKPEN
jgi:uncharacterized protein